MHNTAGISHSTLPSSGALLTVFDFCDILLNPEGFLVEESTYRQPLWHSLLMHPILRIHP